ncbi:MAG: hypothetical protein GC166_00245 [Alphaproteobacteria bacterium]|nr:hypothetical protein [Alphaproteobacteria bacterium]
MTKLKAILTGAAVGLALVASTGANARDRDHDGWRDNSWHERHDHDGYRDARPHRHYVGRDRVWRELNRHHYRHVGNPYWYRGHYVVRAYDRRGRLGFVRVDPYTGSYISFAIRL